MAANALFTDWATSDVITAAKLNQMKNEAFSLDNQVPTLGIEDGAVTSAKVDSLDAAKLTGTLAIARLADNSITASKINDGSGSGLDADSVDGIAGSSLLRSNTSDSYTSGTLTFNLGTTLNLSNATLILPDAS